MFILKLLAALPLAILYPLADLLAFVAYRILAYRRAIVFENLHKAFPEKKEGEIRQIAKKFYKNMADWMVETLKALSISEEELKKRVHFQHLAVLQDYLKGGKSCIILTAHQFNWEWLLLGGSLTLNLPIDAVYMPVNQPSVEKLLMHIRSRFGGLPIPKDQTLPIVVKRLKEQRIIAMVADQRPAQHIPDKYWATFLHQDTAFFMGTEALPKMTKLPVFFMGTKKIKRGHYQVSIEKLAEAPYHFDQKEILPKYIKKVEELIIADPSNWLWTHKRWKYAKGAYE